MHLSPSAGSLGIEVASTSISCPASADPAHEWSCRAQMAAARQDIMAPLSAASMESYSRAYPHLTRLHMLQELADAAALRQVCSAALLGRFVRTLLLPCHLLAHGLCSWGRLCPIDVPSAYF